MRRDVIDYANPRPHGNVEPDRGSLARLSLRLTIGAAAVEGTVIALVLLGGAGDGFIAAVAGAILTFLALVLWMIAVALALAAWADRDGPRGTAAKSLVLLAIEVVVAFVAFSVL